MSDPQQRLWVAVLRFNESNYPEAFGPFESMEAAEDFVDRLAPDDVSESWYQVLSDPWVPA